MGWKVCLRITPAAQQFEWWCSAAAAEMVLSTGDSNAPPKADDDFQAELFRCIKNTPPSDPGAPPCQFGYGSPDGVVAALNRYATFEPPRRFAHLRTDSARQSCAQIVAALGESRCAAAVLVFGGAHWVVVYGAAGQGDPATGSYTIDALSFYNPDDGYFGGIPGVPRDPGPVQSFAHEQLTYAAFVDAYFDVVGADSSGIAAYRDKRNFVIVTDAAAAEQTHLPAEPATLTYLPRQPIVQERVDRIRNDEPTLFPGEQQAELYVDRVDTGSWYALVPFFDPQGNEGRGSSSLMCVDMETSYMGGAFDIPGKITSPNDAVAYVREYLGFGQRHELRVHKVLWTPSRESASPFNPFYVIGTPQHARGPIYVSLDGRTVKRHLHGLATGARLHFDA